VVRLEELIDKALLDREVTDLSAGRLQSLLDFRMRFHFEIGDDEVAGEDGECAHDERLVGGAMLEGVMGVDGFPDDDDEEESRMSGHQSGVDGLAAVSSIQLAKKDRGCVLSEMLFWMNPGIVNRFLGEGLLVLTVSGDLYRDVREQMRFRGRSWLV
jgi:hypothetical protein